MGEVEERAHLHARNRLARHVKNEIVVVDHQSSKFRHHSRQCRAGRGWQREGGPSPPACLARDLQRSAEVCARAQCTHEAASRAPRRHGEVLLAAKDGVDLYSASGVKTASPHTHARKSGLTSSGVTGVVPCRLRLRICVVSLPSQRCQLSRAHDRVSCEEVWMRSPGSPHQPTHRIVLSVPYFCALSITFVST